MTNDKQTKFFKPAALPKFGRCVVGCFLLLLILTHTAPTNFFTFERQTVSEETAEENFEYDAKLQAEADALLHFFDRMPPVPVRLKDEPVLKSGTNVETGLAYTHCFEQERPAIFIKKSFYEKSSRKYLINILKHELTHAWLCRQRAMNGHDERFRKKFKEIGGFGN
jgi:hypothetical protein